MIGQQHIVEALTKYSLENLPKTILLLGENGSEQFDVAKEVAAHFGLETNTILSKVEPEELISYAQNPIPTLYLIDLAEFTEKQQNSILKFIEEPAETVFIMLMAESTVGVLPTILNRCVKFTCARYSKEQLKSYFNFQNDLVYKICKTPGQLAEADEEQINALFELCNKVIGHVKKASYSNTLTLISKINCGKDDTKLDFYQFFNTLEIASFEQYINTKDIDAYKIYMHTNKAKQSYLNKKVAKEAFMLNFLDSLWRLVH